MQSCELANGARFGSECRCVKGMEGELNRNLKSGEAATDERVGLFTPDKKRGTADGAGRAASLAARRGSVCGEVGRVPRFPSTQHPHPLKIGGLKKRNALHSKCSKCNVEGATFINHKKGPRVLRGPGERLASQPASV